MSQSKIESKSEAMLASAFGYLLFEKWPKSLPELKSNEDRLMYQALEHASLGVGRTHPNPPVGAIVSSRSGEVIASAHHEYAGIFHAEVEALRLAGDSANGAELYITLEPCTHSSKRTPPCIKKVLSSNVSKVRIGATDPNPFVNGNGLQELTSAGRDAKISTNPFIQALSQNLISPFSTFITKKRPYVVMKVAASLDGHIAEAQGKQTAITSSPADALVHRLRDACDSIAVGRKTVDIDDPRLTARGAKKRDSHQPIRIIFDSDLQCSDQSNVYANQHCIAVHAWDAPKNRQAALDSNGILRLPVSKDGTGLNISETLFGLYERGITSILIEGGPAIWTSFINAGLVDEIWWFSSPVIFGGTAVPSLMQLEPKARQWIDSKHHKILQARIGPDNLTILRIQKPV